MPGDMHIRRVGRDDLDPLARFMQRNGAAGWKREDLLRFLSDSMNCGLIVGRAGRLLAVLLYGVRVEEVTLAVAALVVAVGSRRRGIGSALLAELGRHLEAVEDGRIEALVSERELAAQLFLRANGFRAVRVRRGAFAAGQDDGYLLEKPGSPARASRGDTP